MKHIIRTTLAAAVLLTSSAAAFAQDHRDDHRDDNRGDRRVEEHHDERRAPERRYESVQEHGGWHRGEQMRREDWEHGQRFDYHEYGLRAPPYGYEWREVNGVFILGAIATGVIADILLNAR